MCELASSRSTTSSDAAWTKAAQAEDGSIPRAVLWCERFSCLTILSRAYSPMKLLHFLSLLVLNVDLSSKIRGSPPALNCVARLYTQDTADETKRRSRSCTGVNETISQHSTWKGDEYSLLNRVENFQEKKFLIECWLPFQFLHLCIVNCKMNSERLNFDAFIPYICQFPSNDAND